jgi:predicted nucleic acid-binding protein
LSFVLDASVALCWCFEDEGDRYAKSIFPALRTTPAVVPAIWPAEFANALLVGERRKRITEQAVSELLTAFSELPIRIESTVSSKDLPQLVSLARKHTLSVYDTLYLDLALRNDLPLATIDKQLKRAARKIGVKLYKP